MKRAPRLTKDQLLELRRGKDPNYKKKPSAAQASNGGPKAAAAASKKRQRHAAPEEAPEASPSKRPKEDAPAAASQPAAMAVDSTGVAEQAAAVPGPRGSMAGVLAALRSEPAAQKPEQARPDKGKPKHQPRAQPSAPSASADDSSAQRVSHDSFVKGVGPNVDEQQLEAVFRNCGDLRSVRIMRDASGVPRGHAYVNFTSAEALSKALQLDGTELDGQQLSISEAVARGGSGRGEGRGGRFAARGRGFAGRAGPAGRGGARGAAFVGRGEAFASTGATGSHQRLQLGDGAPERAALPSKPVAGFMPRSLATKAAAGGQQAKPGAAGAATAPKSNADFRQMLLKK